MYFRGRNMPRLISFTLIGFVRCIENNTPLERTRVVLDFARLFHVTHRFAPFHRARFLCYFFYVCSLIRSSSLFLTVLILESVFFWSVVTHRVNKTMPRLAKSTTVATFIVSTPPPPPPPPRVSFYRRSFGFGFRFPALSLVKNNSSSAVSSGPEHGASRSTASIAPAVEGQMYAQFDMFRDFLSYMERQQASFCHITAVSSFAPVQSSQRLKYTAAPSDHPFSAVGNPPGPFSLPASVSGSKAGGGGVQGQQGRPLLQEHTNLVFTQLVAAGLVVR